MSCKTIKKKPQQPYLMHGCSNKHKHKKGGHGCGPGGCPIPALSWKSMNRYGGTRRQHKNKKGTKKRTIKGGHFYKPAGPIPGPFIGQPWQPPINKWPGMDGVSSNRNILEYNTFGVKFGDISRQIKLGGKKKKKHGGGIIPQDLVNLSRQINFAGQSAINSFNGYKEPTNPSPYSQKALSN
jgi:hypothetical protein